MSKDVMGDRLKMYEKLDSGKFLPLLPICARLDGKGFSKYTKGLERPFDKGFSDLMQYVAKRLVEQTNAKISYTQSDEISLIFYSDRIDSQVFFDGKKQKMISVLSSMATAFFNDKKDEYIPDNKGVAFFDCRVWTVPNKIEAVNTIMWRELDASKNSVSMATHTYFSHKKMMNKHQGQMVEMLSGAGIDWNEYPVEFKRGSYFQHRAWERGFTEREISELPDGHKAKSDPTVKYKRRTVVRVDMPPLMDVTNKIDVIFNGDDPKIELT